MGIYYYRYHGATHYDNDSELSCNKCGVGESGEVVEDGVEAPSKSPPEGETYNAQPWLIENSFDDFESSTMLNKDLMMMWKIYGRLKICRTLPSILSMEKELEDEA